jgi:hypothetical protein
MNEKHLLTCTKYVELNPVCAGLVKNPYDCSGAVLVIIWIVKIMLWLKQSFRTISTTSRVDKVVEPTSMSITTIWYFMASPGSAPAIIWPVIIAGINTIPAAIIELI